MSATCYECDKFVNEYMHCVVCDREFCYNCFIYKQYDENYICEECCNHLITAPFQKVDANFDY